MGPKVLSALLCLFLFKACSAQNRRNNSASVNQASLDKAIEMMEENDDWMNTIKLMMNSPDKRKYKVENTMVFEFDNSEEGQEKGTGMAVSMSEDVMPNFNSGPPGNPQSGRSISAPPGRPSNVDLFERQPEMMDAMGLMVGDVGLCKTSYDVHVVDSAVLMQDPHGPKATLAHPVPIMVGDCKSRHPHVNPGDLDGECVVSAQAHVAWVMVPVQQLKQFENCVQIPGVTSLQKCPTWILVGGRCVFHPQFQTKSG